MSYILLCLLHYRPTIEVNTRYPLNLSSKAALYSWSEGKDEAHPSCNDLSLTHAPIYCFKIIE